jgi:hypothetical protein
MKSRMIIQPPLGDETEPLLAQALSLITGAPVKKSGIKLSENFESLGPVYQNWMEKEGVMVNDMVKLPIKK